jgi:hypothetical protein
MDCEIIRDLIAQMKDMLRKISIVINYTSIVSKSSFFRIITENKRIDFYRRFLLIPIVFSSLLKLLSLLSLHKFL